MESDPDYYDAKVAGWWAWGISMWIGGEWCSRRWWMDGPKPGGVHRQIPKLSGQGNAGVHSSPDRRRPAVSGNTAGMGVHKNQYRVGNEVPRKRPALADNAPARGIGQTSRHLAGWMQELQDRLRRVRVICGDWSRSVTKAVRTSDGITAILVWFSPHCLSARQLSIAEVA